MRFMLTGANGFLGWHVRLAAHARGIETPIQVDLRNFNERCFGDNLFAGVDRLIHVAGINRAGTGDEVEQGNIEIAERLSNLLASSFSKPRVLVYANSIQSDQDNPYGRGKREAGVILQRACVAAGIRMVNLKLPNLFGEEGQPNYNSVVATFAHQAAAKVPLTLSGDRELTLMHAQEAARLLLEATNDSEIDAGIQYKIRVSEVARAMQEFHEHYCVGEIPDITDHFMRSLFNVYRSAIFSLRPVIPFQINADHRGFLVETLKSHGGECQTFFSTTAPGVTRGDHYHLRKIERFVVLSGHAVIRLRKMFSTEVLEFYVSGDEPVAIDMPVGWVHSITNSGEETLLTQFWVNEIFNPKDTDTFYEKVQAA